MPNKYYNRGREFERELVRNARKDGFIAFRSAGSKSPVDVCIIDKDFRRVWFIQAKTGNGNYTKLEKEFNNVSEGWTANFKVIVK